MSSLNFSTSPQEDLPPLDGKLIMTLDFHLRRHSDSFSLKLKQIPNMGLLTCLQTVQHLNLRTYRVSDASVHDPP